MSRVECFPTCGGISLRSTGSIRYKDSKVTIAADGTSTVSALGTKIYQTLTEYDTKGRVKSSTDAYGNTTTYEYDSLDRQIKVKQSNGLITETVYDSQGRVSKSIVKSGSDVRTTEYEYDIYGNIIKTTQPDKTTIEAQYNEKGQKKSETNQLGQTRYFEYDDNGRLTKVTLPEVNGESPIYEYTYDAQGNQLTIKDPNGNVTSFTYDLNGNQLSRTLPDKSVETFEYNEKGQLEKEISFEGVVTTYQYDPYDRLESKTFTQNGISEVWEYVYDEYGRIKNTLRDKVVVSTTLYNELGQIKFITTPEGKIAYTYNEFGQQKSVKTDNDTPINYTYDNYGRLKIVEYDNQTTTYEYDTFGNLIKTTTNKGSERLVATYKYDVMNRLIKLTNFTDTNTNGIMDTSEGVSEFEYKLNAQGNKTRAYETFWIDGQTKQNKIDWTYDTAGRLVREAFDHYNDALDQAQEWEYDLVGNRTKQKLDIGIDDVWEAFTTYSYDVNDRLIEEIVDGQNDGIFEKKTTYGYDHTQQISKSVSENGTLVSETTFGYDLQGRMSVVTIITENRKEVTKYEYGTDGIRTSAEHEVWENGELKSKTKTEYLNDPLNITSYSQVLKQTVTNILTGEETTTTYVIGHQRISQTVEKNDEKTEYYFTFDGHGSTRVLTDLAGAIVQLYAFDAYGNALGFNPADALTEFLYSGEQFDAKIGQQYLRTRYYDPATGRFNRLDPFFGNLNDPQSLHKYLYTHADPINGIDPSGKSFASVSISVAIGAGIGGLGGGSVGAIYGYALYGLNLKAILRTTGIGALAGAVIGGGWALNAAAATIPASQKILATALYYGGGMTVVAGGLYVVSSVYIDILHLSFYIRGYTENETKYLAALSQMIKTACAVEQVDEYMEKMVLVGIFTKGTYEEASLSAGRSWTIGGPHVILSDNYFDRYNNPEFKNDAFESQVRTLLHEAYHVGTLDFTEDNVDRYLDQVMTNLKNNALFKSFKAIEYDKFIKEHQNSN